MQLEKKVLNSSKKLLSITLLLFISILNLSAQQSLEGLWNTGKNETIIEISLSNEQLIGKIKSSNNEKAEIGKVFLKDLRKEGDKWVGEIYAAKRKEWYSVEIVPQSEKLDLKISSGFFSKTLEWKREI